MRGFELVKLAAAATRPLRLAVLRPTMTLADCVYSFDDDPRALHLGVFTGGELSGVGSILPDPHPGDPGVGGWRIRGMAVVATLRGSGAGSAILAALLAHAEGRPGSRYVWCNGRMSALAFYRRHGFRQLGDVYDQPPLGPHALMRRDLGGDGKLLAPGARPVTAG